MKIAHVAALAALALAAGPALADPSEPAFRALYKELVETNTVVSEGSCTKAAAQIATRLKAAGYTDSQIILFSVPEHPQDGGLVAILPGTDPKAKAILMLAHIDVVAARREDWTRDPFSLIEENGFFYGRGVSDDKAQAAIYSDTMIRLKAEKPLKRTVKLALTCGEETSGAFNGADWLNQNRRELIDAQLVMNEGGGGRYRADGTPELLAMQVGEKHYQDFIFEATNPGGHSSRPVPENAIYSLAAAIRAVEAYTFPTRLNDTTRAFFREAANAAPEAMRGPMTAIAANPADEAAAAALSKDPTFNATLRTTCVATQASAGHAQNALPQRARANINCRIIPGETVETTLATLRKIVGDPKVAITSTNARNTVAPQPPLTAAVMGPAKALAARHFPGLPLIPTMVTGATDAPFFTASGIPVYGVPGILSEADGGGIHGLNERIRVEAVLKGRSYLHDLLKAYASQ